MTLSRPPTSLGKYHRRVLVVFQFLALKYSYANRKIMVMINVKSITNDLSPHNRRGIIEIL